MENILKENINFKNTIKKSLSSSGDSGNEILEEFGIIIKRLEYLEK